MSKYEISSIKNTLGKDYLGDIIGVVQETDNQHWNHFGKSSPKSLAQGILKYGDFTRLLYKDGEPIGYLEVNILKRNSGIYLYKDSYKKYGMSITDLYIEYDPNTNHKEDILYVNVIAIKKEHMDSIRTVKKYMEMLLDIIQEYNNLPETLYAVGVSDYGVRMCELVKLDKISVSERVYEDIVNSRVLYKGNTKEVSDYLSKKIKIK